MNHSFDKKIIEIRISAETTPFAARLIERRKRAGLSQEKVAKDAGIKRTTLTMWETGQTSPNAVKLIGLCHALKTTPNDLLGF